MRRTQRPRGRRGGECTPPAFVTFWLARRHGMPRLRQQQDRCQPSQRASGRPCWRVASRSGWRPWRCTEPTMEERLIMAFWRIRSLQLSRREERYLVGSMAYGVVCDYVYGMLRPGRSLTIRETTGPSMVRPAT